MAIGIIVSLTEDQQDALKPVSDLVNKAASKGEPGMCVAQVYSDHMVVGFYPNKYALVLKESLQKLGLARLDGTGGSAFDRPDSAKFIDRTDYGDVE